MLEVTRHLGMPKYSINYGVEQVVLNDGENSLRWSRVTLPVGDTSYSTIVSALINNEYDNNRMQAIINNYLADPTDEEIAREWKEMQEFRAYAKSLAKEFISGIITEDSVYKV